MHLSVVVPCFNEEDVIDVFYEKMCLSISQSMIVDFEMLFIDDGSNDRSWDVISSLHERDPRVKGIKLSRNFGQQASLAAGLQEARGELILIIDADLQDPPELLKDMIALANSGFDVVYGKRRTRAGESFFKLTTSSLFYRLLSKLSDIKIPQDTGDFRLIKRNVLVAYNSLSEINRFTRGLITWLGFNQTEILYDRNARHAGVTKYPINKMVLLCVDAMTGFSLKPLRAIIFLGLVALGASGITLIYTFYSWLFLNTNPGWTSLMTAFLLLSSVQLVSLGVVGEYVGKTFFEAKRRPLYFVQQRTCSSIHYIENQQKNSEFVILS